jgi:hypothetical protein
MCLRVTIQCAGVQVYTAYYLVIRGVIYNGGQLHFNGLTIFNALKRACQSVFRQRYLPKSAGCGGSNQAKILDFYLIA